MTKALVSMLALLMCCWSPANAAIAGAVVPLTAVAASPQSGGTPTLARVEGRLRLATGEARTGSVVLVASVYSGADDATPLWVEQQTVTLDAAGRYALVVGATLPDGVPKDVFLSGTGRWIGVAVLGEPEQPRIQLVAVPYALKAAAADTLAGKSATDFVLAENLGERIKTAMAAQTGVAPSGSKNAGAGASGAGAGTNAISVNALVKYTTAGGAMDSSLIYESGGILTVNGLGSHQFLADGNGDQTLWVRNLNSGAAARSILTLSGGSVANYLISYGSGNVGGLSGAGGELAFYTQGAGGLSLAAVHTAGAVRFYSGGTIERMRLSSGGVWTVSGYGAHGIFGAGNGDQWLNVSNTSTGATARSILNLTAGSVANYLIAYGSGNSGGLSGSAGELAFYTQGVGGLSLAAINGSGAVRFYTGGTTERARITPAGYFGIGTAAPSARLHVAGDLLASGNAWAAVEGDTTSGGFGVLGQCFANGLDCWGVTGVVGTGNRSGYFSGGKGLYTYSFDTGYPALYADANGTSNYSGWFWGGLGVYAANNASGSPAVWGDAYSTADYSYAVAGTSDNRAAYFKAFDSGRYSLFVDTVYGATNATAGLEVNGPARVEGNLWVGGAKSGYVVDIMQNADSVPLEPGDLVVIVGNGPPVIGEIPVVLVRKATAAYDTAVAGMVDQALYVPDAATKAAYDAQEGAARAAMTQDREQRRAAAATARTAGGAPTMRGAAKLEAAIGTVPGTPRVANGTGSAITDLQGTMHALADVASVDPGGYLSVVTLGSYKTVKADASFGAIHAGDLLTTSSNPGYAMKVTDKLAAMGAVIGKALGNLESGTGTIPILVMPK